MHSNLALADSQAPEEPPFHRAIVKNRQLIPGEDIGDVQGIGKKPRLAGPALDQGDAASSVAKGQGAECVRCIRCQGAAQ